MRIALRNLWRSVKVRPNGLPGRSTIYRTQSTEPAGDENKRKFPTQIPLPFLGVTAAIVGAVGYVLLHRWSDTSEETYKDNEEEQHPVTERDNRLEDINNNAAKKLSLDAQLRDALNIAERVTLEATHELKVAAEKVGDYSTKLMCALGESICGDDHHLSSAAKDAKAIQSSALLMAETKRTEAEKALSRLQETIRKGRLHPATVDHAQLDEAERTLTALQLKIDHASAMTAKSLEKLNLTEKFGSAIEESKKQLMMEVNAILPEGKSFTEPKTLSTEDLALLLSDTHKKVEAINKQLSRIESGASEKPNKGNNRHKRENVPTKQGISHDDPT